jgi:myo-inositol-1(or 4)-monophosphatase
MTSTDDALRLALAAADAAGQLLRNVSGTASARARPQLKHGFEVVTDADLLVDQLVREAIASAFPDHRVISEETWDGWSEGILEGPVWVVDPLDGSVNYSHGHPYVSVSIAFAVDGVVQAGVVHAPFLGETYAAIKGRGATLNGESIRVARTASPADALVGTGAPHDRSDLEPVLRRFGLLLTHCRDLRRAASPALDICWVARGVLDAHTEDLAPWDVAAAGLVAREAGARQANLATEPVGWSPDLSGTGYLIAAPGVYDALVALLTG